MALCFHIYYRNNSSLIVMEWGVCEIPPVWEGQWFQSGVTQPIIINATHISTKGECYHRYDNDYIFRYTERNNPDYCYSCINIHMKHTNVLQYKETPRACSPLRDRNELCLDIDLDSQYSMFRGGDAVPISCPFRSPPFSVSYNGGKGKCSVPPSTADSCTDESRLLFRYAACPDIPGSQSALEEMVCLATWKDGNDRFLVARLEMEHKLAAQDEDKFRCFLYTRNGNGEYKVAQSGDATCNGLQSTNDGSKTMVLTPKESQHERCKFPAWVVNHHQWHSLDFAHAYHFLHRNATLRVTGADGETHSRLVCHKIHSNTSSHQVSIVALITTGCENGYICMIFYQRDAHVIQVYRSTRRSQDENEACNPEYFDGVTSTNPVTLVTSSLKPMHCPNPGRFSITASMKPPQAQPVTTEVEDSDGKKPSQCQGEKPAYTSVAIGCSEPSDMMEFYSSCPEEPSKGYNCHGSWTENLTSYLVVSPASRKSTDAKHYCFVFIQKQGQMSLHRVATSCSPPQHPTPWSFNITNPGKCTESSASKDASSMFIPSLFCLFGSAVAILILR
ncbi:hypothetical protein LSTR_LSTR004159 [Laodelphax striatellus]|uniref:Uncharacterized protein n=1 Tax=Laodelphax striatellus TaxID=195883 RepID=A0A482XAL7_LAOST|nr:hypothetical protein LSTR_LSTR004159 [Laodelphax striatellus]